MIGRIFGAAALALIPQLSLAQSTDCENFLLNSGTSNQTFEFWKSASNETLMSCIETHGISALSHDGSMPLNLAAYARLDPTILEHLLQSGADVTHAGNKDWTALHDAAWGEGSVKSLALLIDYGADVDALDKWGKTALSIAAANNPRPTDIRTLIEAGANLEISSEAGNQETPLFLAAEKNSVTIVKLLLQAGADPQAVSSEGETALAVALKRDNFQNAIALLKAGADPNGGITEPDAETPLLMLVQAYTKDKAKLADIKQFLQAGARPNSPGSNIFKSPLFLAFHHFEDTGDRRLFDLLAASADLNPAGKSLLVDAIHGPLPLQTVLELIALGVDVNAIGSGRIATSGRSRTYAIQTPLIAAAKQDWDRGLPIAKALLAHGADVNKQTVRGQTAFHHALFAENLLAVTFLYDAGADAVLKDAKGRTPLQAYLYVLDGKQPSAHMVPIVDGLKALQ